MQKVKKKKGVVDIVFLIDVTASMQPCIDALRRNIEFFIDRIESNTQDNPIRDWRGKVVGYRDYEVDEVPYIDNEFVGDVLQLKQQLGRLEAEGGGDEPESLLEGIFNVANMGQNEKAAQELDAGKWRYRSDAARVVIVFTDASFKDPMHTPAGGTIDDVKNACHANKIILNLFAPDMKCYDRLSAIDKCEWNAIEFDDSTAPAEALEQYTLNQANFDKVMDALAASVSKSAVLVL